MPTWPSPAETNTPRLPRQLQRRLEPGERAEAWLDGAHGSGLALTNRRLMRWRPPGAIASIPLRDVERLQLRPGTRERDPVLIIESADGATMVVVLQARHLPLAQLFRALLADALEALSA
jgi:hypothetical protein